MKKLSVILGLLFSCALWGQNKFPYEYTMTIPHEAEENSYTVDTIKNRQVTGLKIMLIEKKYNEPIPIVTITIKSKDTLITKLSDTNGIVELILKPDNYTLSTSMLGLNSFTQNISLNKNTILSYVIKLGQGTDLPSFYHIYSKTKLDKNKLELIKKCVLTSKTFSDCSCKKYYLSIEI